MSPLALWLRLAAVRDFAALSLGLATTLPCRGPLIDGFGLIAFAYVSSIMSVLAYVWLAHRLRRKPVGRCEVMNLKVIFALAREERNRCGAECRAPPEQQVGAPSATAAARS